MEARAAAGRTVERQVATTTRVGAAALPLGVVLIAGSEVFHPQREDPMNNPAIFMEYAQSDSWTAVHLVQYFGFLLVLGGLVALYYSITSRPGPGSGLAPFGLAAAVTTAASYTVLQAVDGITQARGGRLGGRPGRTGGGRLRGRRGGPVDGDRHEQPLELPHGADPPPVRGCHRPGRGLSALDRAGGGGLWRRVRVQRRGGGGLRGLRTLDRQTGGHTPACGVGFRHGRIDAAQRRSPARQAPLGPGTAIRQPHLETLFHPSAPSRLFATARGVRATAKNTRSREARCLCTMYHCRGGRSRLRRREEGAAMSTQTLGELDFEVLRRAIEDRDAETLVGLYADDAEVITVNGNSTPSSPQILRGKEEIGGYLRDGCGREMTHRVKNEVLDEGRVASQEACESPNIVKIVGAETLEVRDR